jgi:hypothetical protein
MSRPSLGSRVKSRALAASNVRLSLTSRASAHDRDALVGALLFIVLGIAVIAKNADLVRFAAPYFEDGAWLFGHPRWDPHYSVLGPMGGGYVDLFPKTFALLVAKFVPLEWAATVFVVVCLLLKTTCAYVIYAFLRSELALSNAAAFFIAFLTLFVQSANFTLDTLLISSMWNLTTIGFFAVFMLYRLRPPIAALVVVLIALAIWSTIANVAVAFALAATVALCLGPVRRRLELDRHSPAPARAEVYCALLALVGLYFVFGVHYRLLAGSPGVGGGGQIVDRARAFGLVFFERSFVEAVVGRRARDLLAASSKRGLAVGAGVVVIEAALVGLTISAWRRRAAIETAWLAAICGATNVLALMIAASGRYNDGYGAAQHYYIQSVLLLTIVGVLLARAGTALLAAFGVVYLATAMWSLDDIRYVRVIGDPYTNHRALETFLERYRSGNCEHPCRLTEPDIWLPPWSIQLEPP